jgi:hypothetical protein
MPVLLLATVSDIKVIPPLAGVAHFNPVVSALSATNLIQEQSQRIVQIGDYSSVNGDYA